MLICCGKDLHQWDRFEVERVWWPQRLRCLIIGENPGDVGARYFYEVPADYTTDPVDVRRGLLENLFSEKLLAEPTLEAFREAGFLFDHAIRCLCSQAVVHKEQQAARRYASSRVQRPTHLLAALSQAPIVWVMGHLANNAVVNLTTELPETERKVSRDPFPGEATSGSRFFVSEYLSWRNTKKWSTICEAFAQFARARGVF